MYWHVDNRDDLHSAYFEHSDEINLSRDLDLGSQYLPRTALVQFHFGNDVSQGEAMTRIQNDTVVDNMPDTGDLRMGYDRAPAPEVLSPGSLDSGSNVDLERDGPADEERDEDFWNQWLGEIQSLPPIDQQVFDPWLGFYERKQPPETELQPFEEWQDTIDQCFVASKYERAMTIGGDSVGIPAVIAQIGGDSVGIPAVYQSVGRCVSELPLEALSTSIPRDCAEMEMPVAMAYLSGYLDEGCTWT